MEVVTYDRCSLIWPKPNFMTDLTILFGLLKPNIMTNLTILFCGRLMRLKERNIHWNTAILQCLCRFRVFKCVEKLCVSKM